MKAITFGEMRCSLARALDAMGDRWTPLILRDVFLGVNRFDEIVEDLGISRNLLTTRLNGLVESGLLRKHNYRARPARYEYLLTDAGRDLMPVLQALTAWGDRWVSPAEGPPIRLRHERCGMMTRAIACCGYCGGELKAEEVTMLPGPGGAMLPGTKLVAKRLVLGENFRDAVEAEP